MDFAWIGVGLLVLVPMVAAALALAGGRRLRAIAVGLAVLSMLVGATLLLTSGRFVRDATTVSGIAVGSLLGILDVLLLVYVGIIGLRTRRPVIFLLALAQLLGVLYLETSSVTETPGRLVFDGLATVMILVVSVVGSLVALFSLPYMREYEAHASDTAGPRRFFGVVLAFLGAMAALVLADNLQWVYFFWEVTTLASYLLISHPKTTEAESNAAYALTVNSFGGLAFVIALIALSRGPGFSLTRLADLPASRATLLPVALLIFAAFTKAAQFPFQRWLGGAMVAPTPVSALLHSSTMVKAAVYLVVRLAPALRGTRLGLAVAVFGAFTFFAASASAIGQANGKKVLAYSTIANLGLIISSAGIGTTGAIASAVLLIIFHAITKALLFLCVGTIEHGIGTRNIEEMEGVMWKMPVTTVITVLGMLAMVVPPFGMLIGKWLSIESSVRSPLVLPFLVLGSALTLVFWAKWIGRILTVSYHRKFNWEPLPLLIRGPKLLLLGGVVAGSIWVAPLFNWLVRPVIRDQFSIRGLVHTNGGLYSGVGDFLPWPMFLVIIATLIILFGFMARIQPEDIRPPYLCGENADRKPGTSFRSVRDEIETSETGNYYLESVFGEGSIRQWANPVAIAILLLMIGLVR